jgi:hypothetical protein
VGAVAAELSDGVLTIELPKAEKTKLRAIKIKWWPVWGHKSDAKLAGVPRDAVTTYRWGASLSRAASAHVSVGGCQLCRGVEACYASAGDIADLDEAAERRLASIRNSFVGLRALGWLESRFDIAPLVDEVRRTKSITFMLAIDEAVGRRMLR